jgi:septal ring factor EnvC (AmiA/AmiB activator)
MRSVAVAIPALVMLTVVIAVTHVHAEDSTVTKQELERIKREMQQKKQQLRHADRKERSILVTLEKIDREIQTGAAELADQQRKLREAEAALTEIEQRNAGVIQQLEHLKLAYAARMRALYKLSKTGGYSLVLLSADNFSSAYKRVRYLAIIAERDQRLMREYRSVLESLTRREEEMKERKVDLLLRKEAVESKRVALDVRRKKKAEILATVKEEKSIYEATLKDLEESSANLWAMIRLAEQEKQQSQKRNPDGREVPTEAPGGGRLPWPVKGQVLTHFGVQRHPQFGTVVYRRGIDIAAKNGDDVRAVNGGQVAYADWYRGYGRLVIIDHGSGLYTLYGHLSRLDVNGGDRVSQGQVIGLAGDTGSLKGTKLYFEIRRNGEAVDPLAWLAKR